MPSVSRAESDRPEGWQEFAQKIVAKAESTLWSDPGGGGSELPDGRGSRRTRSASLGLGYWLADERVEGIYPDRKVWISRGIVIPWFNGSDVVLINVRRPEGDPKYLSMRGSHRGSLYPTSSGIIAGKPLLIVEGEFDALLLGQELEGLASVVTLGSAGSKPSARVKNAMLRARPWIVAGDADKAGEKSTNGWLSRSDRCVRVCAPEGWQGLDGGFREWTESPGMVARGVGAPRPPMAGGPGKSVCRVAVDTTGGETVSPVVTEGLRGLAPPRRPPRVVVAGWLVEWRQRWGYLTEAHCSQGMPWREAEERAATQVEGELESAGFGPPPAFDYDPEAKFFRDWLRELIENGQAASFLTKDQFSRA